MATPIQVVEMEINSHCNRVCGYCPRSLILDSRESHAEFMSESVLKRIYDELRKIEFSGRISYHLYNEPLLHPDLAFIVVSTSRHLPSARQVLYSNGDLLDDSLYTTLTEAGISLFVITSHDGSERPIRPNQVVLRPHDLRLTNRGGSLGRLNRAALSVPCFAPSNMLIITITGDVLLCYEDYCRSQVMGSLMKQSLEEIWFSDAFIRKRKKLATGDRSAAGICRQCNNTAHQDVNVFDWVP